MPKRTKRSSKPSARAKPQREPPALDLDDAATRTPAHTDNKPPSLLRALEERIMIRFAVLDNVVRDLTRRLAIVEKRD